MEQSFYKIKLTGNVDLMKKAKKLSSIGLGSNGTAIYRTVSFKTKEEVETYLKGLSIQFESVSKMSTVAK